MKNLASIELVENLKQIGAIYSTQKSTSCEQIYIQIIYKDFQFSGWLDANAKDLKSQTGCFRKVNINSGRLSHVGIIIQPLKWGFGGKN